MPLSIIETHSSPNYSSRKGRKPKFIVIHWTGGAFPGSINWVCNKASKVSYHYMVNKDGKIWEVVKPEFKAWHAGTCSKYPYYANKDSIGIGLEGPPTHLDMDCWWRSQLGAAAQLCELIGEENDIPHVIDHRKLAPNRKVDVTGGTGPNKFPWKWFVGQTGLEELPV